MKQKAGGLKNFMKETTKKEKKMKKGYIIDDEFVENENGNFYAFDTVDDLKDFLETFDNDKDSE